MEDTNFTLLVIGFFIGYIIKSFLTFRSGWSATAHLVRKVGDQLDNEFDDWKKETIQIFKEHYPEDYKWQLEVFDWKSAMRVLTDIYQEDRHKETNNDDQ